MWLQDDISIILFLNKGGNTACTNNFKLLKMKQRKGKRIRRRRSSSTINFLECCQKNYLKLFKLYANYQIKLHALHKSCCALASRENYFHTDILELIKRWSISSWGSPQKAGTESRWCPLSPLPTQQPAKLMLSLATPVTEGRRIAAQGSGNPIKRSQSRRCQLEISIFSKEKEYNPDESLSALSIQF